MSLIFLSKVLTKTMGRKPLNFLYFILIIVTAAAAAAEDVVILKLDNGHFNVRISNYGAVVVSLHVPDKNGDMEDIVLGFDSIDGYKNDTAYFGAICGRTVNRIGGAKFKLNGVVYKLAANDRGNNIHGGLKGFSDVVWTVKEYIRHSHVTLAYHSYDGEEGFPGAVDVTLTYKLLSHNQLSITMEAHVHNLPTPLNLASHTYWNLAGHSSGDVRSHRLQIFASNITLLDPLLIPTGEIRSVAGTAYDFLHPRSIASRFNELPAGYDINYILGYTTSQKLRKAAVVEEERLGRRLEVWTNQPGVQLYTSNTLADTVGKGGAVYRKYGGVCLETQGFPDAVNHPNFPTVVVAPGEVYKHVVVYRFTAA